MTEYKCPECRADWRYGGEDVDLSCSACAEAADKAMRFLYSESPVNRERARAIAVSEIPGFAINPASSDILDAIQRTAIAQSYLDDQKLRVCVDALKAIVAWGEMSDPPVGISIAAGIAKKALGRLEAQGWKP